MRRALRKGRPVFALWKSGATLAKHAEHVQDVPNGHHPVAVEVLMDEITAVRDAVQPDEILFVVDAMTGQDAVQTAKAFNDRLDFSGVILTKLDGDARGGDVGVDAGGR